MSRYKREGQGGDPDLPNTEAVSTSSAHDATKPSPARQGDESNPFAGPSASKIVERYVYTDEDGDPLFRVLKWHPKRFTQQSWNGNGWVRGLNGARPVPFHLRQLIAGVGREKWIVEGERDVLSLEAIGEVATCNPMGAGSWLPEFNEWFRDASVTVIADWDSAGQAHALKVYDQLQDVAASVEIVRAKTGKDVTDHFRAGHSVTELLPVSISSLRKLTADVKHAKPKPASAETEMDVTVDQAR